MFCKKKGYLVSIFIQNLVHLGISPKNSNIIDEGSKKRLTCKVSTMDIAIKSLACVLSGEENPSYWCLKKYIRNDIINVTLQCKIKQFRTVSFFLIILKCLAHKKF